MLFDSLVYFYRSAICSAINHLGIFVMTIHRDFNSKFIALKKPVI